MTSNTQENQTQPLPDSGELPQPATEAAPDATAPADAAARLIDWENTRVMLLDDEADDATLLIKILAEIGIKQVSLVTFASRAYYQLAEDKEVFPDILVLELVLAGTNGIRFLARLRGSDDEQLRNLPAVVVTSQHSASIFRRATNQNISGFLRKPASSGQLREALIRAKTGKVIERQLDFGRSWIDDAEDAEDRKEVAPKPKLLERIVAALFFRKKKS